MASEHKRVAESLGRLAISLKKLSDKETPPELSHWRHNVPETLTRAWEMLDHGGELIRATSTKYTLVTKIDNEEGSKLAKDILTGCEYIGTAALVIHDNDNGCSRSMRIFVKQSSRAVIHTCLTLVEKFTDGKNHKEDPEPAQWTGAVWSACDKLQKLPRNNRNAMRRDFMTWIMECQETYQEFEQMLQVDSTVEEEGEMSWDTFCVDQSNDYIAGEKPIVTACLALVKCSRGSINAALKSSEFVGASISETNAKSCLLWIANVHEATRLVAEGMTDLGTLLYPPLELENLLEEVRRQSKTTIALLKFILEEKDTAPEDVVALSRNICDAVKTRTAEATAGIENALENR